MYGFSRSRRACLGQHVAVMQMKKVVLALIMSFDLNFVDAKAPLDAGHEFGGCVPEAAVGGREGEAVRK